VDATRDYCTLFDTRFLPRALALYRSLERCEEAFTLRAVCMDERSRELLERLSLPHLHTIPLTEVEQFDPQLLAVRGSRTSGEYCWTCTSAVCCFLLASDPEIETLTYLDADLYFSSSPASLFAELGDGSILLIPHRHAQAAEEAVGIYNVGWISVRNDERGRAAMAWWRERCLEWCHDRLEPGRYGDQKYLDDWPTRFEGVRVSALPGAGLGHWNEDRHELSAAAGGPVLVDGSPLIYFHHSSLSAYDATPVTRLLARRTGAYHLTKGPVDVIWAPPNDPRTDTIELVWAPYVQSLGEALGELIRVGCPRDVGLGPLGLWLAARRVFQHRLPSLVSAYDHLPLVLRHRIWRALTPP